MKYTIASALVTLSLACSSSGGKGSTNSSDDGASDAVDVVVETDTNGADGLDDAGATDASDADATSPDTDGGGGEDVESPVDTVDEPDVPVSPDAVDPADTVQPEDTAETPDSIEPEDTVEPVDTIEPDDTVEGPDAIDEPDTVDPVDITDPVDLDQPVDAGEPTDTGAVPLTSCQSPIEVNALPFTDSASTIVNGLGAGSLAISGSGCGNGFTGVGTGAPEAVYRYTPTVSGSYAFTLSASFDAVVWVFEDCANPTNTCEVAGKVAAGQTGAFGTYLLSGDPVFIVVDGLFGDDASGSYTLTIEKKCLPNCDGKSCGTDGCGGSCGTCTSPDQCTQGQCETPTATAICLAGEVVGELPWETTGSWWSQSTDVLTVPPSCSGGTVTGGNGKERVLQFTAPYTGRFQASFFVSGMSGTIALYAVKDCTKVSSTCLDGSVGGGFSRIFFDLTVGEKAFIILDETSDATEFSAEYTLSIDGCTADCAGVGCGLESGCADYCGGCSGSNLCGTNGQCTASQVGESCQVPRVIPSVPYSISSDTTGAGNDIDFTVCIADLGTMLGKTDGAADHVYAFTPAQSGKYEAKLTVGTGFEYLAYLVTDCADIAYSCAKKANGQCGDAVGGCSQSLETTMLAGETWYLVVDGYTASESGGYFLDVDATCLEQCGNKECGADPCIGSCGTCAPGTLCSAEGQCEETWHLAINELDYNQTGTDTLEFVEIVNKTSVAAPLAGVVVETINGDNDDVLNSYTLSNTGTTLAPGARLVIGMAAVQASLPAGTAFISASSGFLQNGGTFGDAIRIRKGLSTIDAVSWDAPVTGATEGEDAGTDDGAGTLSRCPDGKDTNDNAADFVLSATATPGKINSCP